MRTMVTRKTRLRAPATEEEAEIARLPKTLNKSAPTQIVQVFRTCALTSSKTLQEPRIRKPFAIVGLRSHSRNPAFPANWFKQMALLRGGRGFCGKPGADNHASSSLQDTMGLRKEHLLVLHVFGAFNRENRVEHARRKIVIQPVAQEIVGIESVPRWATRMAVLCRRNRDRRNRRAEISSSIRADPPYPQPTSHTRCPR